MIKHIAVAILAAAFAAAPGLAQSSSSSSTTTHKTAIGPVTHTKTTVPLGNGTHTKNNVSLGNNSKPAIYVGTATSDPAPNRQKSTTAPTVGVTIPIP